VPDAAPGAHLDPAFLDELRRVIGERRAACPRCGYSLSGVPGPRCPECGRNVVEVLRLADTRPWRLPEERRRRVLRRVLGTTASVGLGVALAAAMLAVLGALGYY
jgi:hypothetical protein